jgi:hypothetical protein
MSQTDIVAAAYAIRPQLKNLLGADAEVVAQQLDKLLTQSEKGEFVDSLINNLLGNYEATGNWIDDFLKPPPSDDDDGRRGLYSSLGGDPQTSPWIGIYTCPDEKAGRVFSEQCNVCKYAKGWARRSNEIIPFCPEFNQPLKLRK